VLIGGIVLGMLAGLALGGRIERLAEVRLHLLPLLFLAVIVRFGTELALGAEMPFAESYRLPLFALAYALLLLPLWRNRAYPGMALAFVGIASNALVIVVNGGYMPVWMPAYTAAGFELPLASQLHTPLQVGTTPDFFLHLGPLADLIPIPIPFVRNVASIGDLFLTAGLAFFLFATVIRIPPLDLPVLDADAVLRRIGGSGSGLSPGLEQTATLDRPLVLGARGVGMASPGAVARPEVVAPPIARRIREHPYVRLALNGSFSALWVGQLISLFGDRVNQLALIAFVFEITDSPAAVAITFLVSTIPNLLFSPIAGTFVDRWDQKQVLIVSDILRASLVLLVPVAILIDVWLAYPLVFLVTTVSIFFRPARVAILPRIVEERDLLAANSAMWVGETIADVVNYPVAGLFVVFLASSLPIAFWFDAATYLASALLLTAIVVPPIVRRATPARAAAAEGGATAGGTDSTDAPATGSSVMADLKTGWSFLRHETALLANTIQATAGQLALGVITVASVVIARQLTTGPGDEYRATYAFMETAIGVGNLIGGFALGLISMRIRKGLLIIAAYVAYGAQLMVLGAVDSIPIALGLLLGMGVANMAFVVPSQTMFQERTPPELMGRVVSLRFALVFGGWSVAMAVGGLLIGEFGTGPVVAVAGLISIVAGLAGLLVREARDA
jgi:DHA3 family macrolide efflux protein-like MFS transporter